MTHCPARDLSEIQMAFNRLVLSSNLRRPTSCQSRDSGPKPSLGSQSHHSPQSCESGQLRTVWAWGRRFSQMF